MTTAQPLIDYLYQLEQQGQSHIAVDPTARDILRIFYTRQQNSLSPTSPSTTDRQQTTPYRNEKSESSSSKEVQQAPVHTTSQQTKALPKVNPTGNTKKELLDSLYSQTSDWVKQVEGLALNNTLVPFSGNIQSEIMLISPAPQYHDELQKEALMGPGGEKLNAILKAMGINRKSIYITNLVKFRPFSPNQQTRTRKPNTEEINAFLPILEKEIEIISPKIILALGDLVTHTLTGLQGDIESLRTQYSTHKRGAFIIPTFHPSYLLFHEDNATKRLLWEDMLTVMERLNLPISQKQRGYFL